MPNTIVYGDEVELVKQTNGRLFRAYAVMVGLPLLGVITIALGMNILYYIILFLLGFGGFFFLFYKWVKEKVMIRVDSDSISERPKEGFNQSERIISFREIENFGVVTVTLARCDIFHQQKIRPASIVLPPSCRRRSTITIRRAAFQRVLRLVRPRWQARAPRSVRSKLVFQLAKRFRFG